MRCIHLLACFLYLLNIRAQEEDSVVLKPEFGMELTSELQLTHEKRVNFVNLLRLYANVPLSNVLSMEAASISTCMTSKESIGDDIQTFSNIDAGNIIFALSKFGLNWDINDNHSLFLGIRNMNEDYFVSPVTSLFTNSSCGIFPTISANFPIANYPFAAVGAHYRYEIMSEEIGRNEQKGFAFQSSIYNGIGYNRFYGRENIFRVCPRGDGVFGLLQLEYQQRGSCYFLGACGHYGDLSDDGRRQFGSSVWAYAEQRLTDRLSIIAAYSHAFASVPVCTDFAGVGAKYSWNKCELGVFSDYGRFAEGGECAIEVTCKVLLSRHVYLQPTAHFIISPITEREKENKFLSVGMLRVGMAF